MLNDGTGFKKVYISTGFTDLRKGIDGLAIKSIYKEIVEGNCALYKDLYQNTNIDECTIDYWKKALELYNSLNNTQKEITTPKTAAS